MVAIGLFASWSQTAMAQQQIAPQAGPAAVTATIITQPASVAPSTLLVDRDTMIRLMVVNEVTTKTAKAGDRFLLRVDEAVVVDGVTVIPVGTKAWGEVVSAEESGVVGKSGKLSARLLNIELPSGTVALRGDNATAGAGGTGETVMGVLGLGPFGLLARGNNAKLKAGEIFNGYPATDMLFVKATGQLHPAPPSEAPLAIVGAQ
ncbi:hypothetical protein CLG96_04255 [Sphingomonas oleivorans]|uniref:Uncharacterized protein n=1 Tax=Sphingomonas oleivorans TaxID=1735121 RepID=A0A2T5G2H1_9SPHN|nr:hypothetical protein [Sphingomonas oleivorans]PTQ13320.1 hypothetical protein CLG96_04255 [Sphingomonas oleivorans]